MNWINVELGPELGYVLSSEALSKCANCDFITYSINRWDFGLSGGLRFELYKGIQIGARYSYGLANMGKLWRIDARNRAFQFSLGYEFSKGKQ